MITLPALVLTAGIGTRLDPLTRLVAKPAVPIGDRTLIERVLSWLVTHGVRDAVLNLHHRPASITAAVGDGAHLGLSVRYSWEQPLLGSAGGPRRALPLMEAETFLIVNGDTLCNVDLAAMVKAHVESGADVTMAVVPNATPDHYNGITADADHLVTGFVPRGQADGSWHFVGIQVACASVFEGLVDGVAAETVSGLYQDLVATSPGRIRVWPAEGTFLDVGTPRDYWRTALPFIEATADDERTAGLVRTVVWPNAELGIDLGLEDCLVIGHVTVPDGFRARNAILAPPALVRPGDRVDIDNGVALFAL